MKLVWHIWHTDPRSGHRRWIGDFSSSDLALAWKRDQDHPEQYTINNVGPFGGSPAPSNVRTLTPKFRGRQPRRSGEDREKRRQQAAQKKAANDPAMDAIRAEAAGLVEKHKGDELKDLQDGVNN